MCRMFFVCLSLLSCTPAQRQLLLDSAWSASECSTFAAMSCAGQAVGGCSLEHSAQGDFQGFSDCLVNSTPSCVSKNVGRCLLSGVIKATGSTIVAAGGVSCTTAEDQQAVQTCARDFDPRTEAEAVDAVAACWVSWCTR